MSLDAAIEAVARHIDTEEFSGVVRISRGGKVLLEEARGYANRSDRVANRPDTRFGLASVTKAFTGAAICRLLEGRGVPFETTVVEVLPADKRPTQLGADVTIHHLLTHTSGIADYYDEVTLGAAAYDQIWLEHPCYRFTEPIDFLPLFAEIPSLGPPGGTEAHYCNAAFILLGLVVEELSGESYADYVTREIFGRAGMDDSGFFRMDEIHDRVAIGYVEGPDGMWKTNHYSIPVRGGPDGGAYSTATDLASFLRGLEEEVFYPSATWGRASTEHSSGDDFSYGYGLVLANDGGHRCFGHGGADPGFSARAYRYPELDVEVTMVGNTIDETDGPMAAFRAVLGG